MEGSEEWLGGRVEQKETIKSDSDRYVVGYGAVEVSSSRTGERRGETHCMCMYTHGCHMHSLTHTVQYTGISLPYVQLGRDKAVVIHKV